MQMITNEQFITLVSAMKKLHNIEDSAEISKMHRNTAGKHLKKGCLPSETKKKRKKSPLLSKINPKHWVEITDLLTTSPELEVTALFDHLLEQYPDDYKGTELRSLQRNIREWRMTEGSEKEVMFYQHYNPGERSQSDFVHMNYLKVTIHGKQYDHILFHFMLPYSGWEDVLVCEGGESFDNLSRGYEIALWKLGGSPKIHRTDNLSAAITVTKGGNYFTTNWQHLMNHYNVTPTVNNPGKSNENGKVERSNGLFKRSLENQLALRKSKNFGSVEEYQAFVTKIVEKRNLQRKAKVIEEKTIIADLPRGKWYSAVKFPVKVYSDSTIRVEGATYSVPSRTIGSTLSAYVYPSKINLMYGDTQIATMERLKKGSVTIDFRHIVHSLKKKPGAFEDYKYKDHMYPSVAFRKAYDKFRSRYGTLRANKSYIALLDLAKMYSVAEVSSVIEKLQEEKVVPTHSAVTPHLIQAIKVPNVTVATPSLAKYNDLIEVGK